MKPEDIIILKRTFEAKLHPKGSGERAARNLSVLTSEYYPSRPWLVRRPAQMSDGTANPSQAHHDETFETKRAATVRAELLRAKLKK